MSRSNGIPFIRKCWQPKKTQCNDHDSRRVTLKEVVGRTVWQAGAPNGCVPQNICSSGKFLLAGRCPWKERVAGQKTIQGCVRQLMSTIAGMCSLLETSFPPPSPSKG